MMWRRRRSIAGLTALLMTFAAAYCACLPSSSTAHARHATAGTHACCDKSSKSQSTPAKGSDNCPHCGHLTVVPAKSPDHAPALTLSFINLDFISVSATDEFARLSNVSDLTVSLPSSDLLSLACALCL